MPFVGSDPGLDDREAARIEGLREAHDRAAQFGFVGQVGDGPEQAHDDVERAVDHQILHAPDAERNARQIFLGDLDHRRVGILAGNLKAAVHEAQMRAGPAGDIEDAMRPGVGDTDRRAQPGCLRRVVLPARVDRFVKRLRFVEHNAAFRR